MLPLTLIFFIICIIVAWVYFRIKIQKFLQLTKNMPGPKPWPFIGNVLDLGTTPHSIFKNITRLSSEYKTTYSFWLGHIFIVFLQDLDHIQILLSNTSSLDKSRLYSYLEPWIGKGLIVSTGQQWRAHRKLIQPTFHLQILQQFIEVFNSNSEILMRCLSSEVDGPQFNIHEYINLCALDCICETTMAVKVSAQQGHHREYEEYVKTIRSIGRILMKRVSKPWLHPDFFFQFSATSRMQAENVATVHNLPARIIKERKTQLDQKTETEKEKENGKRNYTPFLDLLLKTETFSEEEIRDEVNTVMFAGTDAVSLAMCFTCWNLVQNLQVQEKAAVELNEIFEGSKRSATLGDLQKMKYLDQIIKESLRLYPIGTFIARELKNELDIGNYILPVGTTVVLSPYTIHRDPNYFPDPEKFDPDRFLPENVQNRHPFCYIPFSAGIRNCVGQKYAVLLMKVIISRILREYKLLPGTIPIELTSEVGLKSLSGFHMKLQRR